MGGVDTDTNTDTKVTTSVTTTNNTFPLLFTYTANKANNIAEAARFATDLKYNPSTKELTHGGLSFKDGNGNTIGLPTITESTILVVENNLKTINGQSIIGNGDITISGGGSSSGSGAYTEVNHGTSDTTFTLTPNTFHVWDGVSTLTLTLGSETSGVANEFLFQFTSGSESTSLILPDDIKWTNDEAPVIEANKIYQISILKGLGSVMSWGNIQLINFTIIDIEYQAEEGMTWNDWAESKYNSIGFLTSDTYICHPNGYGCVSYMNNLVNISDIILPASYVLYQGSGGGA